MRNWLKLILIIISTFVALSCNSDRCFKRAGDTVIRQNNFESFEIINIYGVFNVELIEDSTYFIEAKGREQTLSGIDFELINDTLNCYYYNSCFWRRDYDRPMLRIHYPEIREVNVMESAYVYSNDTLRDAFVLSIRADVAETNLIVNTSKVYMYNNMSSAGHFIYRGKSNYTVLLTYNAGFYDMAELESRWADIYHHSILDMQVNVTERMKVEIYNKGNILYRGNPEIIIDTITSSGKAIPIND